MFSPIQVAIGALIGTPLVGFLLIGINYFKKKKSKAAWILITIGMIGAVAYIYSSSILLDWLPAPFHLIISTVLMYLIAEKLQRDMFQQHIQENGERGSFLFIIALCFIIWVMLIFVL